MLEHRDRRATPHDAKAARREAVARRSRLDGIACLRVATATRLRYASCQPASPGDHDVVLSEFGPCALNRANRKTALPAGAPPEMPATALAPDPIVELAGLEPVETIRRRWPMILGGLVTLAMIVSLGYGCSAPGWPGCIAPCRQARGSTFASRRSISPSRSATC